MNAENYDRLAGECYAKAREIKDAADGPEKNNLLLIVYHLEQAARIARESSEAKARPLGAPPEKAEEAVP